jgi:hypothetical protein
LSAATRCYELALAAGPDLSWVGTPEGTDALCRLCKQLSDQGWHAYAAAHGLPCARHATPPPGALADGLIHIVDAVALAEEALVLAPRSARAHTTMAITSGRLALFTEDNQQRVALCNRIRTEAETAVALDPSEDVAHHALGRWHYEVWGAGWAAGLRCALPCPSASCSRACALCAVLTARRCVPPVPARLRLTAPALPGCEPEPGCAAGGAPPVRRRRAGVARAGSGALQHRLRPGAAAPHAPH